MMPGLSHEMHVYVYAWWDGGRRSRFDHFQHTEEGMRRLNRKVGYFVRGFTVTPAKPQWRVTPAVFQMFRLHMRMRHGLCTEEEVRRYVHHNTTDKDVYYQNGDRDFPLCCINRGHLKFCM
jgi:hypothetical protein